VCLDLRPKARLGLDPLESRNAAGSLLDVCLEGLSLEPAPPIPSGAESSFIVSRPTAVPTFAIGSGATTLYAEPTDADELPRQTALTPPADVNATSSAVKSDPFWPDLFPGHVGWIGGTARADDIVTAAAIPSSDESVALPPAATQSRQADSNTAPVVSTSSAFMPSASLIVLPREAPSTLTTVPHVVEARLREVTFSGSGLIPIVADPGDPAYPAPPHWYDENTNGVIDGPNDRSLPIGYVRSSTMIVSARFETTIEQVEGEADDLMVRATGTVIPPTPARLEGGDLVLDPTPVSTATPLPDYVDYGEAYFRWAFSTDGGWTWQGAGESGNELYVTLARPISGVEVLHTVIHNSTTFAIGAQNEATVIEKVWSQFETLDSKDRKGQLLYYYRSWAIGNVTTRGLLFDRDGQCGAWTRYFIDQLGMHGIRRADCFVVIEAVPESLGGRELTMFIENWGFVNQPSGTGVSGHPAFEYVNTLSDPTKPRDTFAEQGGVWGYTWATEDVVDLPGMSGQNVDNPKAIFDRHNVAFIDGKYYDVSYGRKYSTLQEWETASVAGYGMPFPTNVEQSRHHWVITENGSGLSVTEVKSTYPL
jgi:hypothetical protein